MNINVERAYFSFIHPLDKYSDTAFDTYGSCQIMVVDITICVSTTTTSPGRSQLNYTCNDCSAT